MWFPLVTVSSQKDQPNWFVVDLPRPQGFGIGPKPIYVVVLALY